MKNKEIEFLWALIVYGWISKKQNDVQVLASQVYDQAIELPSDLESLVVELSISFSDKLIKQIALVLIEKYCLDIERHIILIALLVDKKILHINDASKFINERKINGNSLCNPDDKIKNILDVAWLVNEDLKDGVMKPQDDELLASALRSVLPNF